eukprot:7390312-Prymnesium_polylepis.3
MSRVRFSQGSPLVYVLHPLAVSGGPCKSGERVQSALGRAAFLQGCRRLPDPLAQASGGCHDVRLRFPHLPSFQNSDIVSDVCALHVWPCVQILLRVRQVGDWNRRHRVERDEL